MMPVAKFSVAVEEDLARAVRAAAADEGVSVSAWLAGAAHDRVRNRFLGDAVTAALRARSELDEDALQEAAAQARSNAIVTAPTSH